MEGNQTTPTVVGEEGPERDESEPPPVICWVAINKPQPTSGGIAIPDNRFSPSYLGPPEIPMHAIPDNRFSPAHPGPTETPMHEDPAFGGGGKCQFCSTKVTRSSSLKRHYTVHVNTPLPDPQDREILAKILKEKRYTYHICLICEYFYNRFCELKRHVGCHEANSDIPATWRNPDGSDDRYGPLLGRRLTAKDSQSILDGVKREGLRYRPMAGAKSLKRKREEETSVVRCDEAVDASGSQSRRVEINHTGGLTRAMSRKILQGGGAGASQGNSGGQDGGSGGREGDLQERDGLIVSGPSSPSPLASGRKEQESSV